MTTIQFQSQVAGMHALLRPMALKLTRNTDDAQDLLQDTLLKAISNRDKFLDDSNLRAWVYTIMRNTFISNYHRMVRRKTFLDSSENRQMINNHRSEAANEGLAMLTLSEINASVNKLAPAYKTPFSLHHQGYKYNEIADILSIPIGTVKNRIHIARHKLKKELSSLCA